MGPLIPPVPTLSASSVPGSKRTCRRRSVMFALGVKRTRSVRVITADLRRSGITFSNLEMADGGRNDPSPIDEQPKLEHWCALRELQWTNGLLRSGGARGVRKAAKLIDLYERLYFGPFVSSQSPAA